MIARISVVVDLPVYTKLVEPEFQDHPDSRHPERAGQIMKNEKEVLKARKDAAHEAQTTLVGKLKKQFGDSFVDATVMEVRDE